MLSACDALAREKGPVLRRSLQRGFSTSQLTLPNLTSGYWDRPWKVNSSQIDCMRLLPLLDATWKNTTLDACSCWWPSGKECTFFQVMIKMDNKTPSSREKGNRYHLPLLTFSSKF